MTNEEFIKELIDAEYVMPEAVVPYAKKLVAVAEAAKQHKKLCGSAVDLYLENTLYELENENPPAP